MRGSRIRVAQERLVVAAAVEDSDDGDDVLEDGEGNDGAFLVARGAEAGPDVVAREAAVRKLGETLQ